MLFDFITVYKKKKIIININYDLTIQSSKPKSIEIDYINIITACQIMFISFY